MGKYLRLPSVQNDLDVIFDYIALDSVSHADLTIKRIYKKFQLLADNPSIGTRKIPTRPDVYSFPVGSYIIFYKTLPQNEGVLIIRVVHGARDWQSIIG